jgi:hypothetical protein
MSGGFADGSPDYEAWLASRRFRIVRSRGFKLPGEVVATGLLPDDALQRENELNAAERESHPELDCWTRDLFIRELETPPWKPKL